MSAKSQHNNILLAVLGFTLVVVVVGLIGFFTLGKQDETIQGEVEVSEYRVSCKLPGRVVELRVKEGDYVHVGDTLAILEIPEIDAQKKVAQATGNAAKALQDLTDAGARKEQIQGAFEIVQQAKAAEDIAKKTYTRMQHLYDEGVMSGQKRDEAFAAYKATEAQVKAAQSQYNLARNGAREQEKRVASNNAEAAQSTVDVVSSLLKETVQIAQVEGEVSDVYPKVGELVGMGSPIMSISIMSDKWGTFNIREDQLKGMKIGDVFTAFVPAFNKDIRMK
ncbi:MAG: HlyD family secretion protein, partial [Prevotella sp.]